MKKICKKDVLKTLKLCTKFDEFEKYSKELSKTISQENMHEIYTEILQELTENDLKYSFIVDVLDFICGGSWAKGFDYYDKEI